MNPLSLSQTTSPVYGQSLIDGSPIAFQGLPQVQVQAPQAATAPSAATVTAKIEAIASNPSLTDKEKRAQINELRKQLGISKGDMKKYFTKPLERAYAQKIDQLKASGIDTPQKAQLLEQLEAKKKLYNSMYKAGGCVKKVFKGIGKGLETVGKVALGVASAIYNPMSLIPQVVSMIGRIPGVGKVVNAVDKVSGWIDAGQQWWDETKGIFFGE